MWKIRCKKAKRPLWQVTGAANNTCNAYCGGIDLQFSLEKLLKNMQGYLDSGFNAVKIKVGCPCLEEDLERIEAVRELIGDNRLW